MEFSDHFAQTTHPYVENKVDLEFTDRHYFEIKQKQHLTD